MRLFSRLTRRGNLLHNRQKIWKTAIFALNKGYLLAGRGVFIMNRTVFIFFLRHVNKEGPSIYDCFRNYMPSFKLLLEDKGTDLANNLWDTNRLSQGRVRTGRPLHANGGNQSKNNWGCPPTPNFANTFNLVCRNHESLRPLLSRLNKLDMVKPWTQPPDNYCRGFTIIIWHPTWIVPFQTLCAGHTTYRENASTYSRTTVSGTTLLSSAPLQPMW